MEDFMKTSVLLPLVGGLLFVVAQQTHAASMNDKDKIRNAMSSAPASVAAKATIKDWPAKAGGEMPVLRAGSNGWTCLPDMPDTEGNDPMCLDDMWLAWADAWMNKKPLKNERMGFGYMLQQNGADSNTDPYATAPAPDNEWMKEGVPHMMILVPDATSLKGVPTDPHQGGPWVMWRGTPYVHVMAPMPLYKP